MQLTENCLTYTFPLKIENKTVTQNTIVRSKLLGEKEIYIFETILILKRETLTIYY